MFSHPERGFFPNGIAKVQQIFNAANFSSKILQKLLPLPRFRSLNLSNATYAMNIDILSKMVRDLILDNDKVSLPGLGSFVTESVPASFSNDGYAIRPPYRKVYFRRNVAENELLARAYSKASGMSLNSSEAELREFVLEMKAVLDRQKVIIFPGLGKLRATQENNYFFVTDDNIDICPEYNLLEVLPLKVRKEPGTVLGKYSFASVETESVKTESVETESAETESAETEYKGTETAAEEPSAEEPAAEESGDSHLETVTAEGAREQEPETNSEIISETKSETKPKKRLGMGARVAIWTCAAAAAAFAAFVLVSRLCPGSTDFLLYSNEEIEYLKAAGL